LLATTLFMATASSTAQQAISKKPFDGFDNIFLNGKWRHGSSDQAYDDTNPYTNEVLVRIHLANEGDLNEAFHAARYAQPNWCRMLPAERSKILRRAADIMEERREEIVGWLIRESGSTRIKANVEWQYAHGITLEAATFPSRIEGPIMPCDIPGKENRVYRQPVGVVGMISPWNFPFHLSSRSIAPAIALGNTVVIKPASDTPVTGGLLLGKIYEEAGLPAGVLNVVIGQGSVIGRCVYPASNPARALVDRLNRSRPSHHGNCLTRADAEARGA
jgi:aldehyde dehydrogenase (NAD+)